MNKKSKERKCADDYLEELRVIAGNLPENHPMRERLAGFVKKKKKAIHMIDHYLFFEAQGKSLFSITIMGHDPFLAKVVKHLITDGSRETSKYISSLR